MNERPGLLHRLPVWAGYLVIAFLMAGLVFHTADRPVLFGKYAVVDVLFAVFLAGWALAWKRLLRFICRETSIKGPEGREKKIGRAGKLIYLAVLTLLAGSVVEIYLRTHTKVEFSAGDYDPYLQNALGTNNQLRVNPQGFRGEPIERAKKPGAFRIFYLGGSTFLGASAGFENSHPRLVEKALRKQFPDRHMEVQNAGNHWHTTEHSIIKYLFNIKDYQPDLILMCHNINDLYRSFSPPEFARPGVERDYSHFYGPVARMVRSYFRRPAPPLFSVHAVTVDKLAGYLRRTLFSDFRRMKEVDVGEFAGLPSFRRNLLSMVHILRQDGVRLILVTEPYLYRDDLTPEEKKLLWMNKRMCVVDERSYVSAASMARGMDRYNRVIKEVAETEGVPLLDLEAAIPKTAGYFRDDCHYTDKGHWLVADTIYEFLTNNMALLGVVENATP